ncbi:VOC family protein [Aestuariivirga litoralis]|uniref:VOC family protein n=1 Tax=Aestuariivirga litoralis TaxID=2650924 RepID=UPI0018C5691B|nr:VOC family protein [Aestuariivirga litoralis]MBG1231123.1 VOC family protein [Aestuariivirga litoralis]
MLDHIGIPVTDFTAAKAFYGKALAPLGITMQMDLAPEITGDGHAAAGFGKERPQFWIGESSKKGGTGHVAFTADSRAIVDEFYKAAIAAGGKDNGAPGLRPHYHENYYGAFVLDPDGHNIEAVCHKPE